ncbi:MAG: hypothetical protein GSR80_000113 [Desulfurococcales archaeon]|nr:hypothetical protein [Desulfurococcales archaeon]
MGARASALTAALALFLFLLALTAASSLAHASSSGPLVCVYYYPWYGGPDHPWQFYKDTPVLGLYNSSHLSVIARHLGWLRDLGVDCLFISWWGPGHFTDRVAQEIFKLLPSYGLRAAILVEPYKGDENPEVYNSTWWNETLAYLRENYIDRYPEAYLRLEGKPLVLAFNPIGLAYDPRPDHPGYAIRIVGNDIDNARYQDWDLWPDYDKALTGHLRIRRDGYVSLAPRFDDEHFRPGGVPPYDPDLSRGWYQRQWEWVLRHRDAIRIVAIYSWNEFHERSAIEPHNDATAHVGPYYLYDLTKHYIQELRQPEALAGGARLGASIAAALALASTVVALLVRLARS